MVIVILYCVELVGDVVVVDKERKTYIHKWLTLVNIVNKMVVIWKTMLAPCNIVLPCHCTVVVIIIYQMSRQRTKVMPKFGGCNFDVTNDKHTKEGIFLAILLSPDCNNTDSWLSAEVLTWIHIILASSPAAPL